MDGWKLHGVTNFIQGVSKRNHSYTSLKKKKKSIKIHIAVNIFRSLNVRQNGLFVSFFLPYQKERERSSKTVFFLTFIEDKKIFTFNL